MDLTSELVDLITAQRNFQANAKAIETPAQAAAVAALDIGAVWSAFRARTGKTPAPLALYYYPDNASTLPHMLLREMGLPHQLRLVDRRRQAQRD